MNKYPNDETLKKYNHFFFLLSEIELASSFTVPNQSAKLTAASSSPATGDARL